MNVPVLRFPEFRDAVEWKKKRFEDIAIFAKGKGISKSDISPNGKQPCIRYGELYTYYNETIESVISYTDMPADDLVLSEANDVIIPASGETQIDIATASCVLKSGIALGGDLNIIRSKMNGVFLSYYLNNAKKKDIAQLAQGISVVHLYSSQLKKLNLNIPELSEQQKIAACLSSLDELITAQTQKVEALNTHKKGLMQQLFPAEGETVPKLRFPEFREEWNETNLESLVDLQSGYAFQSEYFSDKGKKLLTPKNFSKNGYANFNEENTKFTTEYFDQKYVCKEGDLLLLLTDLTPSCELLGKPILLTKDDGEVLLNQRIVRVIPKGSIETRFLLYFFLSDPYHKRIKNTATGSTVRHSSNKIVASTKIYFPSEPEQQKIAACLSSLDELIAAQSQKVEALLTHKKGLMQQLFPAVDEVNA
ncbi:MAG: restriction endonuclease subunit S [Methylobacter sp.]|nr:restriction endonuclease subunit S [Methylobacter sp.]